MVHDQSGIERPVSGLNDDLAERRAVLVVRLLADEINDVILGCRRLVSS